MRPCTMLLLLLCLVATSCTQQSISSPLPIRDQSVANTAFKLLYSFRGIPDGYRPFATLIATNGNLYGTTFFGGSGDCKNREGKVLGCGTVFEVSTSGNERVLYSFKGPPDGQNPAVGLTAVNGRLYGTTVNGGSSNDGTIFEVAPADGTERVLHNFFQHREDGATPWAGLIAVNDVLYGVTKHGGENRNCTRFAGCGTVFAFDLSSGEERVLYAFPGYPHGGLYPLASLVAVRGALYGTTLWGSPDVCNGFGCGTVFSIDPSSDKMRLVYSFKGKKDGAEPASSLVERSGVLYGTTQGGGSDVVCNHAPGCGTVFAVRPLAVARERVVYRFKGSPDGGFPSANLIEVGGALYGTTRYGGSGTSCLGGEGCGTVFALDLSSGKERIVHSFNNADGNDPYAALINVNGALYGTTAEGGAYNHGGVFRLTP